MNCDQFIEYIGLSSKRVLRIGTTECKYAYIFHPQKFIEFTFEMRTCPNLGLMPIVKYEICHRRIAIDSIPTNEHQYNTWKRTTYPVLAQYTSLPEFSNVLKSL